MSVCCSKEIKLKTVLLKEKYWSGLVASRLEYCWQLLSAWAQRLTLDVAHLVIYKVALQVDPDTKLLHVVFFVLLIRREIFDPWETLEERAKKPHLDRRKWASGYLIIRYRRTKARNQKKRRNSFVPWNRITQVIKRRTIDTKVNFYANIHSILSVKLHFFLCPFAKHMLVIF